MSTKAIVSSCKQTTPVKSVIQRLHIIFMLKIFVPVPYSLILKKIFLDPALCTVHVRVLCLLATCRNHKLAEVVHSCM